VSTAVVCVVWTYPGARGCVERSVIQFSKKCPLPPAGAGTSLPAGAAVSASLPARTRKIGKISESKIFQKK